MCRSNLNVYYSQAHVSRYSKQEHTPSIERDSERGKQSSREKQRVSDEPSIFSVAAVSKPNKPTNVTSLFLTNKTVENVTSTTNPVLSRYKQASNEKSVDAVVGSSSMFRTPVPKPVKERISTEVIAEPEPAMKSLVFYYEQLQLNLEFMKCYL